MSAGSERLADYPFHHAALGEFEFRSGRHETAREHFQAALGVARNSMERADSSISALARANVVICGGVTTNDIGSGCSICGENLGEQKYNTPERIVGKQETENG